MAVSPSPAGIGSKRLVVGAHYGVGNFLLQRLTAVVLTAFTLFLALRLVLGGRLGYDGWAALFVPLWMKIVTLVALLALFYHAWIGVRDIWMDYVKPVGVRLALEIVTLVVLVVYVGWTIQILWGGR